MNVEKSLPTPASAAAILDALTGPVLSVDARDRIRYANLAAEEFFAASVTALKRLTLSELLPFGSPVLTLVEQARASGAAMREYGIDLGTPRTGPRLAHVAVTALGDPGKTIVVSLQETSIASKMDRQLTHRGAARSVAAMAAVLAHEIKNPLSGIRGAAQLIEQDLGEQERELTQLICDETDRIRELVERMDVFSDRPIERSRVNIHEVLDRVRRVAETGFGASVRISESYDPSLPPAFGNFDQLVQVFLNLVKNACEAVDASGGEVVLSTAFRHGVRLSTPGSTAPVRLPLEVCVQDNGPGVPPELQPYLFDPFVTTKTRGSGLGLALVAKLIGDHGGVIECDSRPRRTIFRTMLPMYEEGSPS